MKTTTKKVILGVLVVTTVILGALFLVRNNDTYKTSSEANPTNNLKESESVTGTKIIAIGDSLTAGYGLELKDSYPNILEEKLKNDGYNVSVINAGISGETTAGLLDRVSFILKQKPEIVLITIGGNDAFRNLPLENTRENILQIASLLKKDIAPNKIFLMRVQAPENLGINYKRDFDSIYEEVAEKEGVTLVQFVEPEVFLNNKYIQSDGIHPNGLGYKQIVDQYIYPAITEVLIK